VFKGIANVRLRDSMLECRRVKLKIKIYTHFFIISHALAKTQMVHTGKSGNVKRIWCYYLDNSQSGIHN
jgi:hypothetical protein